MKTKFHNAFSSIEIMLAVCVFVIISIGVFYLSIDVVLKDAKVSLDAQALFYAQEGVEAVISIRDRNFLNVVEGTHGLVKTNGQWTLGPPPEVIDEVFQRKIIISDIYRNELGNIDPEGSVLDVATKKITAEVFWYEQGGAPRTTEITTYVTDWRGDKWITTTCGDFQGGTMELTATQQSAAPPVDNCNIQLTQQEVGGDDVASVKITGNAHSNDVEVDGNYAYLMKRKSPELVVVSVANPSAPSIVSELDVGGNKTDATFVTKNGNYLYLSVGNKTAGLVVVDVTNPASPVKVRTVNIGDYGYKSTVAGNYLFVPVANKGTASLKLYNITNPAAPVYVSTISTVAQAYTVAVSGNYAYVGLNNSGGWGSPVNSFAVYNITNMSSITKVTDLNVGDWINVIKISGPIAFLGMTQHHSNATFVAVNINNPAVPTVAAALNVNNTIADLALSDGHAYASVDSNPHAGLLSFNVSNPFAPRLVATIDAGGKSTGVAADLVYVYVSVDTSNKGLAIFEQEHSMPASAGSYVSSPYDTGSPDTLYNYIEWDASATQIGMVKFQIRTADTAGNLESATWVGPDGTDATFYDNSRTIITLDPSRSGSRYYQYKAYFTSNGLATPVLESVNLDYTP